MQEQQQKSLGSISEFSMRQGQMNFTDMPLKEVMILVGQNGTGKTLVLKSVFMLNTIMSYQIASKQGSASAQWIFEHTMDDPETMSIELKCTYKSGASIHIQIEQGTVMFCDLQNTDDITQPTPALFMSSNIRLFSAMKPYLSLRKTVMGQDKVEVLKVMLGTYKLYDVMIMEALIQACPIVVTDKMKEGLAGFDIREDISSFHVDFDKPDFYFVMGDSTRKNLSSYGNGHQALFNMSMVGAITQGSEAKEVIT